MHESQRRRGCIFLPKGTYPTHHGQGALACGLPFLKLSSRYCNRSSSAKTIQPWQDTKTLLRRPTPCTITLLRRFHRKPCSLQGRPYFYLLRYHVKVPQTHAPPITQLIFPLCPHRHQHPLFLNKVPALRLPILLTQ